VINQGTLGCLLCTQHSRNQSVNTPPSPSSQAPSTTSLDHQIPITHGRPLPAITQPPQSRS
jgi:hypothetical protein